MAKLDKKVIKEIKDLHLKKAESMIEFCEGKIDKERMMYDMDRVDEDLGGIIQGAEDGDF